MYLGFDIGGSSIKAGIFDSNLKLMDKVQVNYYDIVHTSNFPEFLIDNVVSIYHKFKKKYPDILSVGFGIPGVVNENGVVIVAPNMNGIIEYPFKQILSSKIELPFCVDNDANVAALAELYEGNGKSLNDFIYITLGTGIGGAIISNSKIFRGSSGGAGEVGHIIIDINENKFDNRPYRQGTVEVVAGRHGIIKLANELKQTYPKSNLFNYSEFDVEQISILAETNDELCKKVIEITGFRIGVALVNVANVLDIPFFIIGGGISRSDLLLKEIQKTLILKAIPSISKRIKVERAAFLEDTGIVGAAIFAKYFLQL